jgi:DNA-binding protein HU-beta
LTKDELTSKVAEAAGLTSSQADAAVKAVFAAISADLKSGGEVKLAGFGSFAVGERAARQGRNPQTGETIEIAASRAVKFKPAKALKDAVNG